jgi:tetratricopeptide (TPR) repeat protein
MHSARHGELASVDEAERSLRQALEQDSEYVPSLLELGWLYHALRDDSRSALMFFQKALAISEAAANEALNGASECRRKLESEKEISAD